MTDTEFWIETVKRALGGDKAAQWEIQQFVAMQSDKRHDTALLIDRETGETAYRHNERNVDLPAPIVTYLATLCAMVTDAEMDPRAALLSKPPKKRPVNASRKWRCACDGTCANTDIPLRTPAISLPVNTE